jgi:hypothetical protein
MDLARDPNAPNHVINLVGPVCHKLHSLALDCKDLGVHDNYLFGQEDKRLFLKDVLLPELGELQIKAFVDHMDPVNGLVDHLLRQGHKQELVSNPCLHDLC